jgi:uncharacterized membrane protein
MRGPAWTEQRVDEIIGGLLRVGVIVAAALVLLGGALYVAGHGSTIPDYRAFHGEPAYLRGVPGILSAARALDGPGLIQLGLLVLLATPLVRVAFSVLAFAHQRDRTYVVVTSIVLAVLLYSLAVGGG